MRQRDGPPDDLAAPVGARRSTSPGADVADVADVADEGPLVRLVRIVLAGQSGVLIVIAFSGFVFTSGIPFTATSSATVLALGVNGLHCTVLLVAGVLGALAACGPRWWLRWWTLLQAVGFLLLLALGTTLAGGGPDPTGMNLNGPDRVLHGLLAALGAGCALGARSGDRAGPPRAAGPHRAAGSHRA